MDNNNQNNNQGNPSTPLTPNANTTPIAQSEPTNPIPTPPIQQTPPVAPPSPQDNNEKQPVNKSIFFIVAAIIIVVILALLYFFALNSSNQDIQEAPVPIPTASPTPIQITEELTEDDIETIDLGNPEGDLEEIEEELNNL